jgi:hypothetical protein
MTDFPNLVVVTATDAVTRRPIHDLVVTLDLEAAEKNGYCMFEKLTDTAGRVEYGRGELELTIYEHQSASPMDHKSTLGECLVLTARSLSPQDIEGRIAAADLWGPAIPRARLTEEQRRRLRASANRLYLPTFVKRRIGDLPDPLFIELRVVAEASLKP